MSLSLWPISLSALRSKVHGLSKVTKSNIPRKPGQHRKGGGGGGGGGGVLRPYLSVFSLDFFFIFHFILFFLWFTHI